MLTDAAFSEAENLPCSMMSAEFRGSSGTTWEISLDLNLDIHGSEMLLPTMLPELEDFSWSYFGDGHHRKLKHHQSQQQYGTCASRVHRLGAFTPGFRLVGGMSVSEGKTSEKPIWNIFSRVSFRV